MREAFALQKLLTLFRKNESSFALQKLLTFFRQKNWHISDISIWNFNETLTNDVFSFEQPGHDFLRLHSVIFLHKTPSTLREFSKSFYRALEFC